MVNKDFFKALIDLEEQKGIDSQYFIESLESALTSAYKKNFGEAKSAYVKLNPEKNSIKVYSYKTVVAEITDPDKEILLGDAKLVKKSIKVLSSSSPTGLSADTGWLIIIAFKLKTGSILSLVLYVILFTMLFFFMRNLTSKELRDIWIKFYESKEVWKK